MGYEAFREQTLERQNRWARAGRHRAAADQPHRNERDADRSGRKAVPDARRHASLGFAATTTRSASSHAWPRCTRASSRTPTTTSAACSTTSSRTASSTTRSSCVVSDNGASGEGGPNGSVNEMKFANGVPDDLAENLAQIDDLGGTQTYNHYPNGWAMAFNTPFKMWKRYELQRRNVRPVHRLLAQRHQGSRRDPPPVLPRNRHRADDPRRARRRSASDDQGVYAVAHSMVSACATSFDDATQPNRRRKSQFYAMLGSRCDLARGLEGRHDTPDGRRVGQLQRRRMGAVPRRRRPFRGQQPRRQAARQAEGAHQHLVFGGRYERRFPARRPFTGRDPRARLGRSWPLLAIGTSTSRARPPSANGRPSTLETARS